MDNIQLYYIDNEINKVDEMKEGDVIYRIWFIASDCSDARVEGLRQGREDKIHGFEFTSQTRDKIRRLITDTSGLRSHRFLYDKEDDKKQRSAENRLFKKYACRDWDGRGSTQWKSFPT